MVAHMFRANRIEFFEIFLAHYKNVYQSSCIEKILNKFYMDKAHALSIPMVIRLVDANKDLFRPCGNDMVPLEHKCILKITHELILHLM